MKSKLLAVLTVLLVSTSSDAACILRQKKPVTIEVQSCQIIDSSHPVFARLSREIGDPIFLNLFIDSLSAVTISSPEETFLYFDILQNACDTLSIGDTIQAIVEHECCDGAAAPSCGLGFDTYITQFNVEK